MGRPRKSNIISAEQATYAESHVHDYGEEYKHSDEEIAEFVKEYTALGVRLDIMGDLWKMTKGKLSVSGNNALPKDAIVYAADYLVAQDRFVRAANRRDKNGNLAIGNIIDKSGNDISHGAY